jgi:uncharacterized protein (TIGR03435 family)
MMLRIGTTLTLLAAAVTLSRAADGPPTFDVASIKASPGGEGRGGPLPFNQIQATPGSLTMRKVTLKMAVAWAYHVFEYQVNGPDWTGSERYDIAAKATGPAGEHQLRQMLQTLLAERFKLEFHRQTKEMQAYLLEVGKNGPKFQESKSEGDSDVAPDPKRMVIEVHRMPIAQLVEILAKIFQTPVIDLTGLTARYDVSINAAKYLPQSGDRADPLSIIQTGLAEELGLKMEAKKYPVDLLIIDRAEKAPAEN